MILVLQTYNGTSITTYNAKIPGDPPGTPASIIGVERVNDLTAYGGKSFRPTEFDIAFALPTSGKQAAIEAIAKLFHVRDSSLRTLVANDSNDSNAPYYIECTAIAPPKINGNAMTIKMWASDPVWKKVTARTKSISVTGSGTTNDTVVNDGNVDAYPTITITPTATGGAWAYRRHVIMRNPNTRPMPNYPVDITNGGFDTSALVKSTAKSNQINEGAGINASVDTWNIDAAVGGGLPSGGGYFTMESEQCSYTGIAAGVISGVVRGINGTTPASHADNVVMYQSLIQANGNDIRVRVGGVEHPRWLGGTVLTDTTEKIWSVFDFDAEIHLTLGAAISATSGVTSITFANTDPNKKALNRLPDKGILYIDTEAIAYTAINRTARKVTIADTGRGIKDTTAATHTNGTTAYFIPFDVVIEYGNMTADTLVQDETREPCFSKENSTNTNWRWDSADSVFADEAGLRSGAWKPSQPKGKYSSWYGGNQATYGTDPITNMGAEIITYQSGSIYKAETAQIWWTLHVPATLTEDSSLGEKYKLATTTPFPTCRLLSSKTGADKSWVQEWAETTPGSAATWTAWTHANNALPAGTQYLRFEFTGAVKGGAAQDYARNEVNLGTTGSMEVDISSSGAPQVTLIAQGTNSRIDVTITNTATGDGIAVAYPVLQDTTLTIDTEARTVSYQDRLLAPVEWTGTIANRQEWLRLQPGNNPVTYVDAATGAATVVFTYKERKNV